jgi:carbamoyl-phosphate synthase large subunit
VAFFKAEEAATPILPLEGTVLMTISEDKKKDAVTVARQFEKLGFKILATRGTHAFLEKNGVKSEPINKLTEGRPNITDAISNGQIQLVINTPAGRMSQSDDSYIRKGAIKHKIPYITTIPAALASAKGIAEVRTGRGKVKSLQEYHASIG